MPLKNWGGFSINRSWIYDALEKIVLAGLADQVLLNTKPLSRVEAARIVAQAVQRLELDESGDYNHRDYMEDLLYRLVKEFGSELSEMGVRTPLNRETRPEFFGFKAIDNAQFGADFANRSQRLINNSGRKGVLKGGTAFSTLDGRVHVGDFLSFYYWPEFSLDQDTSKGRLINGYGKFTLWNTELEVGRDSLWWGPGTRGSMSFSTNGAPLDQVRLSSAEPFRLPWLLNYLGPMKATLFVGGLGQHRDFPNAKVAAWRASIAPSRFVELGFNRMFQFGGRGREINPGQFLKLLFTPGVSTERVPTHVNNVMSLDATLRIPDVERYILIARDMSLYFDFGWDDTKFGIIVPDKPGGIVGTYLTGLFGDPMLDLRIEYAKTSNIEFNHFIYTDGFTNRGSVLSHFIGTEGSDIYARITRWISPNILSGFHVSRTQVGSPLIFLSSQFLNAPRERRDSFGVDVSYRISDQYSIFLAYDFAQVKNRRFVAGRSGKDNLFRIEFTRSFSTQ